MLLSQMKMKMRGEDLVEAEGESQKRQKEEPAEGDRRSEERVKRVEEDTERSAKMPPVMPSGGGQMRAPSTFDKSMHSMGSEEKREANS